MAKSKQALMNKQRDVISELRATVKRLSGTAMQLYEVTNGMVGCSYTRVYVWEVNCLMAKRRALHVFQLAGQMLATDQDRMRVTMLFDMEAEPFCTKPSSEGWET